MTVEHSRQAIETAEMYSRTAGVSEQGKQLASAYLSLVKEYDRLAAVSASMLELWGKTLPS